MSIKTDAHITGSTSQQVFEMLLSSLAEPGTIHMLPAPLTQRGVVRPCWLLLALADVDVSVNVDDDMLSPHAALVSDIVGAPIVPLATAQYVALTHPSSGQVSRLKTGDALHPEAGASVGLAVGQISHCPLENGTRISIHGPGIPGDRTVEITGIDVEIVRRLGTSSGSFPTGFDSWLFADNGAVVALPRSTTIHVIRS